MRLRLFSLASVVRLSALVVWSSAGLVFAPWFHPPAAAQGLKEDTLQVLALVNSERTRAGLAALKSNDSLTAAAQGHAQDMAVNGYFSHTSLDGRTLGDRIRQAGYSYRAAGENIAWGQRTPSEVVSGWMASPGHRRNILNPNFRELGIGLARDTDGVPYWVQNFGSRDSRNL